MDLLTLWNTISPFLIEQGPKIIVITVGIILILKFGNVFIEKLIRNAIKAGGLSKAAEEKRENTLIRVFGTALNVFVVLVGIMMLLSEIGIDTTPLIASAGIAGIAVGFGGQYLIKDVINGFFIILENQYRVGDVVKING